MPLAPRERKYYTARACARREIAATDVEIDNLVCELYGITDEERKIIEGESP